MHDNSDEPLRALLPRTFSCIVVVAILPATTSTKRRNEYKQHTTQLTTVESVCESARRETVRLKSFNCSVAVCFVQVFCH